MNTLERCEATVGNEPSELELLPLGPDEASMGRAVAAIHGGKLMCSPATSSSRALVTKARGFLARALTSGDERALVHGVFAHASVAKARAELESQPWLPVAMAGVLASIGFPRHTEMDTPRLRVIPHRAELEHGAAPLFVVHRDTWYGCPQSQVNVWMPLHDLSSEQSFAFYPEFFRRPIVNGSAAFDYARWTQEVGWHGAAEVASYPQPQELGALGREQRFALREAEVLLFAAHHLHGTKPHPRPGQQYPLRIWLIADEQIAI